MKIIKRVPWGLKFVCTGCKSELEAEADDIRYYCSDDDSSFYCECVVCGQHKDLKYGKDIPDAILNKAREAYNKKNRR